MRSLIKLRNGISGIQPWPCEDKLLSLLLHSHQKLTAALPVDIFWLLHIQFRDGKTFPTWMDRDKMRKEMQGIQGGKWPRHEQMHIRNEMHEWM